MGEAIGLQATIKREPAAGGKFSAPATAAAFVSVRAAAGANPEVQKTPISALTLSQSALYL